MTNDGQIFYPEFANKTLEELYEDRDKLNHWIEELERDRLEVMRTELFKLAEEMGYKVYAASNLEYGDNLATYDVGFRKI